MHIKDQAHVKHSNASQYDYESCLTQCSHLIVLSLKTGTRPSMLPQHLVLKFKFSQLLSLLCDHLFTSLPPSLPPSVV